MVKIISSLVIAAFLAGCSDHDETNIPAINSPTKRTVTTSATSTRAQEAPNGPVLTPFRADNNRQINIKEDHNKDNFDFSLFNGVIWSDKSTFGPQESGNFVVPTKNPLPDHLVMNSIGLSKNNYYVVSIKGDGSCWIRSAIQSLLFPAFQDAHIFSALIDNIRKASIKYAAVPGFSERFLPEDLIALLKSLKSLSPQERLAWLNNSKVDLFLDYSMRSLLHALMSQDGRIQPKESMPASVKEYLTSHSSGDASIYFRQLAHELLPKEHIKLSYSNVYFDDAHSGSLYAGFYAIYPEQITKYNNILKHDMRSLKQVKKDCLNNSTSACNNARFVKSLQKRMNIKSFSELHTCAGAQVLPMLQRSNHYALIVHKNSAQAFGY